MPINQKAFELIGEIGMRIDDEGLDADRAQMIERESDQRLPVILVSAAWGVIPSADGQQRLPRPAAKNESLSDFVHEQKIERFLDFARNHKRSVPYGAGLFLLEIFREKINGGLTSRGYPD